MTARPTTRYTFGPGPVRRAARRHRRRRRASAGSGCRPPSRSPAGPRRRRAGARRGAPAAGRVLRRRAHRASTCRSRPGARAFQRKVWDALRRIEYGTTRTYGQIADEIGAPARRARSGLRTTTTRWPSSFRATGSSGPAARSSATPAASTRSGPCSSSRPPLPASRSEPSCRSRGPDATERTRPPVPGATRDCVCGPWASSRDGRRSRAEPWVADGALSAAERRARGGEVEDPAGAVGAERARKAGHRPVATAQPAPGGLLGAQDQLDGMAEVDRQRRTAGTAAVPRTRPPADRPAPSRRCRRCSMSRVDACTATPKAVRGGSSRSQAKPLGQDVDLVRTGRDGAVDGVALGDGSRRRGSTGRHARAGTDRAARWRRAGRVRHRRRTAGPGGRS